RLGAPRPADLGRLTRAAQAASPGSSGHLAQPAQAASPGPPRPPRPDDSGRLARQLGPARPAPSVLDGALEHPADEVALEEEVQDDGRQRDEDRPRGEEDGALGVLP